MTTDIENLYIDLKSHIDLLDTKFIDRFIPPNPNDNPEDYHYEVRAFCVLSHAAIEEYFEKISLRVMHEAINQWLQKQKASDVLLTLIACHISEYSCKMEIDEDERNAEKTSFTYLRPICNDIKDKFSKKIQGNHGTSIKYLRKLLTPVSLDIKPDANLLNSLQQLAKERGDYAHKGAVRKVIAPEDARKYISDCLLLCEDIKEKAMHKFI